MGKMEYHNPVLLQESVDGLDVKSNGIYVNVTFGGGGHSKELLNRLGKDGRLFGFDMILSMTTDWDISDKWEVNHCRAVSLIPIWLCRLDNRIV